MMAKNVVTRRGLLLSLALTALAGVRVFGQESYPYREVTKEHQWLMQLTGEWTTSVYANENTTITSADGVVEEPPPRFPGTESVRALGPYWVIADGKIDQPDLPIRYVLTLGYDPIKKKFVGTSISSVESLCATLEGTLDESGKVLTLEGTVPYAVEPSTTAMLRLVITLKSPRERIRTSAYKSGDAWKTLYTMEYTKK